MTSLLARWHVRGWGTTVIDQAVIAVTNFMLSVTVARVAGVSGLGQWGLLVVVAVSLVGFNRTILLEPFAASRGGSLVIPDAVRWLLLGAGAVGAAVTGLVVVFVPAFENVSPAFAVWLGAVCVVQDGARYLAFKVQYAGRALRSDLSVLAVSALTLAVTLSADWDPLNGTILAWSLGLTVGALVNQSWRPRQTQWRTTGAWWVANCSRLARSLLEDSIAYTLGIQILLFGLAQLGTASEVGTTRAVSSLFSPLAIAFTGLNVWLTPHLASRPQASRTRLLKASFLLGAVGLPMLLLATLLGPQVIPLLFGSGVSVSHWDVAWGGLASVAAAASLPVLAAARVANQYQVVAHARSVAAVTAILALWFWPIMQGSEGYLGLVAVQGCIVLAAGVYVVAKGRAAKALRT